MTVIASTESVSRCKRWLALRSVTCTGTSTRLPSVNVIPTLNVRATCSVWRMTSLAIPLRPTLPMTFTVLSTEGAAFSTILSTTWGRVVFSSWRSAAASFCCAFSASTTTPSTSTPLTVFCAPTVDAVARSRACKA